MMRFFILLLLVPVNLYPQSKFPISGRVTDMATGEDLIGATVVAMPLMKGVPTNSYGFYSLTLPPGDYKITWGYIGYESYDTLISLTGPLAIDIELKQLSILLDEIIITSGRVDRNITSAEMGVEKLDLRQADLLPVLMGEKDILKTIQLLPGISTASEGSTGFNVRGGSSDQNLILLDEAAVYSASHLMGFFSVFNSDAIKDVTIYKGGIPARYGGRASSVLDISMNNGNSKEFTGKGGIGLISTRLTLEAPIIREKISFIVSGRRSYADLVLRSLPFYDVDNSVKLYFYDLNAKLNYRPGEKDRIFISGYFGRDVFGFEDSGIDWGNATATLRWNHLFSDRLFSNTSLIYSDYAYGFNLEKDAVYNSGIRDYSFKEDITWYNGHSNILRFGEAFSYRTFNPGELTWQSSQEFEIIMDRKEALESALYFSGQSDIGSLVSVIYGLRITGFSRADQGQKKYLSPEPRLSLNIRTGARSSIKFSYNRITQYLHLLSNSTSGQATDIWIPSSEGLKPIYAGQVSGGLFMNFFENIIESSVEVYYKNFDNITDFEDGTSILLNENIESQILAGDGRSYGAEFYVKKSSGIFSGWISYTLSRTEKRIGGINNGEWYPTRYDKIHDISFVTTYRTGTRLSLSMAWVYGTGNAVTFPSGKYTIGNNFIPWYTERNGYRMPPYHRLDLNIHLDGKKRKGSFESGWDFSIYNLYNRHNAYTIDFRESETLPGTTEAVKLSLFGIVPSITWNFRF
ncbi:MAG: TonB-dependent receptor [Bacteroidia bacterium]|nr:MAG: TonB-dependent receptor [Bacteroidia bacterium]